MDLQKFEITLERTGDIYSPGEVVAGRVVVHLNRPESITGLKVYIDGKAHVKWTDTAKTENSNKTRLITYRGGENYFSTQILLLNRTELQTGLHHFQFEFRLPRNLPNSFEAEHASIKYEISAIMERPPKPDSKTSHDFIVVTCYDLSECIPHMTEIDEEEVETFCCFPLCFKVGAIKFNVFVPNRCFAVGELILTKLTMSNTSANVDATRVELQIVQELKFHANHPELRTKEETVVVKSTERDGPFNKNDEVVVEMLVPWVPHSKMIYCSIVDIAYYLQVIIHVSGCHCAVRRKYPIAIGAKPASRDQFAQIPATSAPSGPMPSAPFFPGKEYLHPAPGPMGPMEGPPPSYNDATGGRKILVPYQR